MSRLVELNRLTLQTRQEEEREFASLGRKDPDRVIRLPSENRGGVREVYTKVGLSYIFGKIDVYFRFVTTVVKNSVMEPA